METDADATAAMIAAQHNLRLDPEMAARGQTITSGLQAHQFGCLVPITVPGSDDPPSYDANKLLGALMDCVGSR